MKQLLTNISKSRYDDYYIPLTTVTGMNVYAAHQC